MAISKKFEWIIFDLGGVLIKITPDRFYKYISDEINISIRIIQSYKEDMALGYQEPEKIIEGFINKYRLNITADYFIKNFCELYIGKKIDGMFDFIKELKRSGYKLGLLSNTNKLHIEYLQHKFNDFEVFDTVFYSYKIHHSKPDIKIYEYVLRQLKTDPDKIFFIDDTESNIKAASSLGIQCLQVEINKPSIQKIKDKING